MTVTEAMTQVYESMGVVICPDPVRVQGKVALASIFDNDLYKFTMQQAILEEYSSAVVQYRFNNRNQLMKYTFDAFVALQEAIDSMADLVICKEHIELFEKLDFMSPSYVAYLKQYQFDPSQVSVAFHNGDLEITVDGPWHETVLWEVPLMALISQIYFAYVDTDWDHKEVSNIAHAKAMKLNDNRVVFAEFGTRRRRDFTTQATIVPMLRCARSFVGTSNVHLALDFEVKAIGTIAHELYQGISGLETLRYANRATMEAWIRVYDTRLGVALADTYGLEAFFGDFSKRLAKAYDGVRHDSGCPIEFANKMIKHYESLDIDPTTKTIVFSDGLNVDKAIELAKHCKDKIKCSFGIGTHFTNDFTHVEQKHKYKFQNTDGTFEDREGPLVSKPMNMVIKLWSVNGIPVVKLGAGFGKESGDRESILIAKYIFHGDRKVFYYR